MVIFFPLETLKCYNFTRHEMILSLAASSYASAARGSFCRTSQWKKCDSRLSNLPVWAIHQAVERWQWRWMIETDRWLLTYDWFTQQWHGPENLLSEHDRVHYDCHLKTISLSIPAGGVTPGSRGTSTKPTVKDRLMPGFYFIRAACCLTKKL